MKRALALLCLALGACSAQDKAAAIQTGLDAGMAACDMLIADPTLERTEEVDAFCRRMVKGCKE